MAASALVALVPTSACGAKNNGAQNATPPATNTPSDSGSGDSPSPVPTTEADSGTDVPCSGDECESVTLATDQETPQAIAVDATNVYWTTMAGDLRSVAVKGGKVATLAKAELGARDFVLGNDYVYWIGMEGFGYHESIYRTPLSGGSKTPLVEIGDDAFANGLSLVKGTFYWGNFGAGGIHKAPLQGGSPQSVAPADSPRALASDDTHVYWVDYHGSSVEKAPLSGGGATPLATDEGGPSRIVLDGTTLYFANFDAGEIKSVQTDGSDPKTIAMGQDGPGGLAVRNHTLYWTAQADGGVVRKLPPGATKPVDIATDQGWPRFITTDGTFVYWTTQGEQGASNGSIRRAGR